MDEKCRIIEYKLIRLVGDKSIVRAVFAADSIDIVPGKNDLDGFILDIGSAAWIVPEGKMYAMDSEGNWVKQGG